MRRAVLDTNLFVSYLISHRPPIATLIDVHLANERFRLVTGVELLQELDRVLCYPRLHRYYDDAERTRFVALVAAIAEIVELPDEHPAISRDRDDDKVIACAVAGAADAIVSGDKDLISLGAVGEIPILTPSAFEAQLSADASA